MHAAHPQPTVHPRRTRSALLGAVSSGLIALAFSLTAAPQATAADAIETSGLDKAVTEAMLEHSSTAQDARAEGTPLIDRKREDASGQWVFGSAVLMAPHKEHAYPEGWLFVAHETKDGWKVGLEGTPAFADVADEAPAEVVDADEKQLFAPTSPLGLDAVDGRTRMRLPWTKGQTWTMSGGPHNSGFAGDVTRSSFDFAGGDGMVKAVRSGRVYKMCGNGHRGWLRVVHDQDGAPTGYSTDYYHLANNIKPPDGTWIGEDGYLGNIGTDVSCGGSASGAHVHFSVRRNSQYVAVHGLSLGAWTFYNGAAQYQGYARHGSTVRGVGQGLFNYGSLNLKQGVVDAWDSASINLRAGPGTSFAVVGQAVDGAIPTVLCSSSGTTHTGRYGATNLWDRITNSATGQERWMSDAFLDSRVSGAISGSC